MKKSYWVTSGVTDGDTEYTHLWYKFLDADSFNPKESKDNNIWYKLELEKDFVDSYLNFWASIDKHNQYLCELLLPLDKKIWCRDFCEHTENIHSPVKFFDVVTEGE